jgi:hypothetical protein
MKISGVSRSGAAFRRDHNEKCSIFMLIFTSIKKNIPMSLLNQQNNKGKKKGNKKNAPAGNNQGGSKFIQKPKSSGFVSKQSNTGSQRGS